MSKRAFKKIAAGLRDALAIARGEKKPARCLPSTDEKVWRACEWLRLIEDKHCERCHASEEIHGETCTNSCRVAAEEIVNVVETGNPWRKPEPWPAQWGSGAGTVAPQASDHFTYRIAWSEEDGEYVGTCAEFPSLSRLDDTPEAALHGIRELVKDVTADMEKYRELVPEMKEKRNNTDA